VTLAVQTLDNSARKQPRPAIVILPASDGRIDSLDPDSFKYEITSREIPSAIA